MGLSTPLVRSMDFGVCTVDDSVSSVAALLAHYPAHHAEVVFTPLRWLGFQTSRRAAPASLPGRLQCQCQCRPHEHNLTVNYRKHVITHQKLPFAGV